MGDFYFKSIAIVVQHTVVVVRYCKHDDCGFYFYYGERFILVFVRLRQSATLSFAAEHVVSRKSCRNWKMKRRNTPQIPLANDNMCVWDAA